MCTTENISRLNKYSLLRSKKTVIEFVEVHSQVSKKENTDKFLFYFFGYDFHVGGFTAKKKTWIFGFFIYFGKQKEIIIVQDPEDE